MTSTSNIDEMAQIELWNMPNYIGTSARPDSGTAEQFEFGSMSRELMRSVAEVLKARAYVLPSFNVYAEIAEALDKLMVAPEEDEFGKVRPAANAMIAAKGLLFHLTERRSLIEPEDVSTDRDGGIRVSWRNRGRFLELVFPYESDIRPYLYFSEGTLFDISEGLAAGTLDRWITWIEGGARP